MSETCIIFDLDGTLVDSETPGVQAFIDLLPEIGDPVEQLVQRYRGEKLSVILSDLEQRLDRKLPVDFEARYRRRVSTLFAEGLEPIPGVVSMLEELDHPLCIASGGPPAKMAQILDVSGLAPFFGGHLYSSYTVDSWKPDPGLFLHAARDMGYSPDRCIVVEDSAVGIRAANAAEMTALQYVPSAAGKHEDADLAFHEMAELPEILRTLGA